MKLLKYFPVILPVICTASAYSQHLTLSSYDSSHPVVTATGSITLTGGFYVPFGSGFHAYIVAAPAASCVPLSASLSQDRNYIVTYTPREPFTNAVTLPLKNTCEVMQTVQYFDGLGRPLQTVQVKGSPEADKDLVTPFEYDAYGREAKKYLPYTSSSADGSYKTNALLGGQGVFDFYNPAGTDLQLPNGSPRIPTPFAQTGFEPSPLNRVVEQGAPGDDWQLGAHTVRTEYWTNTAGGDRAVRLYHADIVSGEPCKRTLSSPGNYEANQLYLTISKDENWVSGKAHTMEEYKGKEGYVVLKRSWDDNGTALSTYYVYDDLGNLSFVLPPGAEPDGGNIDQTRLNNYCYQYRYDNRRRLIEKRIPGKDDWESTVYNKLDQVVLTQDPLQKQSGKWIFTKYDGLGRVIMTGEYQNSAATRNDLQDAVSSQTGAIWESYTEGSGYSNLSFPLSYGQLLTVNYYDDYTFPGSDTFGELPSDRSSMTKSLLTGSFVNVLSTSTMLLTMNFYDDYGRISRTKSQNYVEGTDETVNTYSFTNELLTSTRYHTTPSGSVTIATRYEYDHMGRKKQTFESIGGATETLLAENVYNEVGQLKEKKLHEGMQSTAYTYNPRGWLKSSTSSQFSEQLNYEDAQNTNPNYNGNISNQLWGWGTTLTNTFTYSYDALNRLNTGSSPGLSENISYDHMGNITSLTREGYGTNSYTNYDGNRLKAISGFTNGSYQYDANGNTTTDGPKGVMIAYNLLNLPSQVSGNQSLTYTYTAAGEKLRKQGPSGTTDYVGGVQYQNGSIDFIQTEEGIARRNGNSYSYEYNLKDHLGNVRATFYRNPNTGNLEVLQRDDYYAFGLRKVAQGGTNKYLYNGKELQEELEEYDYGARFYDPETGRWTSVDPSADEANQEIWSPYAYVGNNPISRIDPDGRFAFAIPALYALGEAIVTGVAAVTTFIGGKAVYESYKNRNGDSFSRPDNMPLAPTKEQVVHMRAKLESKSSDLNKESQVNSSRGKNKLEPNKDADGDHSSLKRDQNGDITNTATYKKNPQNPNGFDEEKRVDVKGGDHYDKKTGKTIPTPHVHEGNNTRPAKPEDLPQKKTP